MRILFLTCPGRTHLYSFVPLAWALQTAGHQVRVASQLDATNLTAADIAHTGLPAVVIGDELDTSAMLAEAQQKAAAEGKASDAPPPPPPAPAGPRRRPAQREYAAEDPYAELDGLARQHFPFFNSPSVIDGAVRYARRWRPDLVIWDTMTMAYAGPVAAQAVGAAHARFVFGADALGQLRIAAQHQGDPLRAALEPILDQYGLAYNEHTLTGHWSIFPMPTWTWTPPGMDYLWMRPVPYNGPSVVPDWVLDEQERKRVCITLGVTFRELDAGASTSDLLEAVADLDAEVVVTLGRDPAELPTLPANVRAVDFVPLAALLPSCSAVVHHGGYGTFATALEHGVPQLVVPGKFGNDRFWGPYAYLPHMEDEGAAVYVSDHDQLTPDVLHDSLQRVLKDPAFGRNAARMGALSAALPTPNDSVPAIERLTAHYRS
ncbi:nucleotide disphospho-sugar-binding domain-containing protein [Micromonospora sp. NPDC051196]|uniref:nucleotide disphospho-sugar-binding domain-containing protein n=1 Tax=Micromonospora sp. NPDC051196 TaxID=3155281 RepID=UPI0034411F71